VDLWFVHVAAKGQRHIVAAEMSQASKFVLVWESPYETIRFSMQGHTGKCTCRPANSTVRACLEWSIFIGKAEKIKTEESFLRIALDQRVLWFLSYGTLLQASYFKGKQKSNLSSCFLFLHEVRDNQAAYRRWLPCARHCLISAAL
jgi:hypothetical protein